MYCYYVTWTQVIKFPGLFQYSPIKRKHFQGQMCTWLLWKRRWVWGRSGKSSNYGDYKWWYRATLWTSRVRLHILLKYVKELALQHVSFQWLSHPGPWNQPHLPISTISYGPHPPVSSIPQPLSPSSISPTLPPPKAALTWVMKDLPFSPPQPQQFSG